jgi:hypothetical protein
VKATAGWRLSFKITHPKAKRTTWQKEPNFGGYDPRITNVKFKVPPVFANAGGSKGKQIVV